MINTSGYGAVFVPTNFLNLSSREAVDIDLHRLVRIGFTAFLEAENYHVAVLTLASPVS